MLSAYYGLATPLISQRFGGEVEKFIGDAIMATFNTRGDQPDHAIRAAGAAVELQRQMRSLAADHPDWPRLRVGVNTGQATVREMGGPGDIAYAVVGDTVNVASRLQTLAPLGDVLIGHETYPAPAPERHRGGPPRNALEGQVDSCGRLCAALVGGRPYDRTDPANSPDATRTTSHPN